MKRILITLSIFSLVVSGGLFGFMGTAAAATNNNLIDDYTFDNTGTMSAAQIDSWLNAFSSSCISPNSGFTAPDPTGYSPFYPYVDGKYTYGGAVTAGQVIYDAAIAHHINPQVILTKLQNEEQLVDGSQGCDNWRYTSAVGYACTDSGTNTHNYTYTGADPYASGAASSFSLNDSTHLVTPLYYRNGVAINSITGSCVNANVKAGFSEQVVHAAWLLSFSRHKSEGQISWAAVSGSWNHCEDNNTCAPSYSIPSSWACYSGLMTQGNLKRCPTDSSAVYYDGYATIDGQTLHMDNGATASLYVYTPHIQSFASIFTAWFGSPTQPVLTSCNSKVADIDCVWSLQKTDGSQFLTSSLSERNSAMANYGWTYDGIAFYASETQQSGTIPVHRLRQNGLHFYTADQSEYSSLMASGNWIDEGIVFYVYPSVTSTNASHYVYRLYDSSSNIHYLTTDTNREQYFIDLGYVLESNTFNSFSGVVGLSIPASGRDNIYRSRGNGGYFYTTNLTELENVVNNGYMYEGVLTTANASNAGTPIYRLQRSGKYFYTADAAERDNAVGQFGYVDEGIGFYVDNTSDEIYRLHNSLNNRYLYTSSINEAMSVVNNNGWIFEGSLVSKNTSPSPVYRFLNFLNHRHFYTIDINEAMRITNKGWGYETIAFSADKSSGLPVYRLLSYDKHLYTTDANEKDTAISKYGYQYEGVAFYVSQSPTSTPVYRLQSGNGDYLYTVSTTEKDNAVSKFGYVYEGVGFYL